MANIVFGRPLIAHVTPQCTLSVTPVVIVCITQPTRETSSKTMVVEKIRTADSATLAMQHSHQCYRVTL